MTEFNLPHPSLSDCTGELHPKAREGIELFNTGKYWKAHEALESAWRQESGEIRHLYRAILQVGVAYLHVQQYNYRGAIMLHKRCQKWLTPFPEYCRGINLGQLRKDFENVIIEVKRLGPDGLLEFNLALLKPILWDSTGEINPA